MYSTVERGPEWPSECGANKRDGGKCTDPPLPGRRRCHAHGGAPGSGAPSGAKNGRYKTGEFTKEARQLRKQMPAMVSFEAGRSGDLTETALSVAVHGKREKLVEARVCENPGPPYTIVAAPPEGMEQDVWKAALKTVFATESDAFAAACLDRLMNGCNETRLPFPTTASLCAALAMVQSMEPENEVQATLAVHAACLQTASFNMLKRVTQGILDSRVVPIATAASRLLRAYDSAIGTYYSVKRGNTQTIRVHRMVLQPGSQAVVGQVVR